MRAACRKFLNIVQEDERHGRIIHYDNHASSYGSRVFNSAIGEMRGVFGIHIAMLATEYGLDVENELAAILPGDDTGVGENA